MVLNREQYKKAKRLLFEIDANERETFEENLDVLTGPPGKDGQNGRDGRDGLDGRNGRDGKDGKDGKDGEPGPRGEKGDTGESGASVSLKEVLKELKPEIVKRLPGGGGGAYRNIALGGNSSVLSRYNDINLKAGSNVTITYQNNDNTKTVDVTFAASGSGPGGGIVRAINSISASQTADGTSGTDSVYICSAGIQLILPDAVGNTNLYTVKNTSTSSVLVSTTNAETIDGSANLVLATQYTSVDVISDGANWQLT